MSNIWRRRQACTDGWKLNKSRKKILVTGGAGYIGSHTVKCLRAAGIDPIILDNFSTGYRWALQGTECLEGDLGDLDFVYNALRENNIEGVLHFAGYINVGESVENPAKYYINNAANTFNLLKACADADVDWFVFSSTCAVYGLPSSVPISEDTPIAPISPYGASKQVCELALMDVAKASNLRFVILRYFNAAGADPSCLIGEAHDPETHLIPLTLQAALGRRPNISIFGEDYPTADGTCVRDYVHVDDLAQAHLDAVNYLKRGGGSQILNCGYGQGYSVREVIAAVKDITSSDFPVEVGPRRDGDPAVLVASNEKIRKVLKWKPKFNDLRYIVNTAWEWEKQRPSMIEPTSN